jgi:hypothetical protein
MFPTSMLYGFTVGFVVHRACLVWTIVLLGVLALLGAFMHWAAGQMGLALDWVTPQASLTGALLTFVLYVPVALLGSVVGRKTSPHGKSNES